MLAEIVDGINEKIYQLLASPWYHLDMALSVDLLDNYHKHSSIFSLVFPDISAAMFNFCVSPLFAING